MTTEFRKRVCVCVFVSVCLSVRSFLFSISPCLFNVCSIVRLSTYLFNYSFTSQSFSSPSLPPLPSDGARFVSLSVFGEAWSLSKSIDFHSFFRASSSSSHSPLYHRKSHQESHLCQRRLPGFGIARYQRKPVL